MDLEKTVKEWNFMIEALKEHCTETQKEKEKIRQLEQQVIDWSSKYNILKRITEEERIIYSNALKRAKQEVKKEKSNIYLAQLSSGNAYVFVNIKSQRDANEIQRILLKETEGIKEENVCMVEADDYSVVHNQVFEDMKWEEGYTLIYPYGRK